MSGSSEDRHNRKLSTVAALIGKAQSTTFPAEQESLVLGAYSQLAEYLNSLDRSDATEAVRRDRRHLVDRRVPAAPHEAVSSPEEMVPLAVQARRSPSAGDVGLAGQPESAVIDLRSDRLRTTYKGPIRSDRGKWIDVVI